MQRRRVAAGVLVVVLLLTGVLVVTLSGAVPPSAAQRHRLTATAPASRVPDSIEAGVEPWQMASPLSREAVVATGTRLIVLGGITPAGTSLAQVSSIDPRTGAVTSAGSLAIAVHDAATTTIGRTAFVLGGGSPDTVSTVQSFPVGLPPALAGVTGSVAGQLPQPRSDLATATLPDPTGGHVSTTYVVGGYDGTHYLPSVLATTDGTHFTIAARLPIPVRYPAVVADAGHIYAFGGQVSSPGAATAATDDIQMIDPVTHRAISGRSPAATPLRRVGLRPRREHLCGRRAGPRGGDPHPDRGLRAGHQTGTRRRPSPPSRCLRRIGHARRRTVRHRLHGRRRGSRTVRKRSGRRGFRHADFSDLAPTEPLRGSGRTARGRLPLLRHPSHR